MTARKSDAPADYLDGAGYPTEAVLGLIEGWPYADARGCLEIVRALWRYPERATRRGRRYRFSTGGWSGNEDLIAALRNNFVIWGQCWQSSHRGGLHLFEVRP